MRHSETDILIIGGGGAGLFAALHAHAANPKLRIALAVKGLLGKCGCTRMVQGGYNAALGGGDSVELHFRDTIEGGKWLPHQELAWRLCETAPLRVRQLENEYGCFFDRNHDGTLHQKPFAGQRFDRTVHKGDLTGIEIMNRLMEQARELPMQIFEEHRALALLPARDGGRLCGALLVDMRGGEMHCVHAAATLLATGGGPTMYRYHTPSGDKSMDGLAMALRLGLGLRDMEMVQFHPTGLLAGADTRMTGTVLEEGLRGAGGHILNGDGRRFLLDHDAAGERATRDIVSRAMFAEMRAGRAAPNGGVWLTMRHLGADSVRRQFPGMVKRCADCGFDLAAGQVEVAPTAHYFMGGVVVDAGGASEMPGLFVAGEDTGGVHGANRLGGNGVANSTVFGGIAGESMAKYVASEFGAGGRAAPPAPQPGLAEAEAEHAAKPFSLPRGNVHALREKLQETMWRDAGVLRDAPGLRSAMAQLAQQKDELRRTGVGGGRAFNPAWHDWLNLRSLLDVSEAIAAAALARENSRGAHFREDFPGDGGLRNSHFTVCRQTGQNENSVEVTQIPVAFTILQPPDNPAPPA